MLILLLIYVPFMSFAIKKSKISNFGKISWYMFNTLLSSLFDAAIFMKWLKLHNQFSGFSLNSLAVLLPKKDKCAKKKSVTYTLQNC